MPCNHTIGTGDNPAATLKLTSENLFLTLAPPAEGAQNTAINTGAEADQVAPAADNVNTPLLQFLALMLERKKAIKPVGKTADGLRTIYEHRGTHNRYEVPIGNLDVEFFVKIQEHLGVLVVGVSDRGAHGLERTHGEGDLRAEVEADLVQVAPRDEGAAAGGIVRAHGRDHPRSRPE